MNTRVTLILAVAILALPFVCSTSLFATPDCNEDVPALPELCVAATDCSDEGYQTCPIVPSCSHPTAWWLHPESNKWNCEGGGYPWESCFDSPQRATCFTQKRCYWFEPQLKCLQDFGAACYTDLMYYKVQLYCHPTG